MIAVTRQLNKYHSILKNRNLSKKEFNPLGFVFFREDTGIYLETKYFEENFKQFIASLGLSNINIHSTRHTFATQAVMRFPHDIASVKEILGHANLETTLKYTHAFDKKKKKIMQDF